MILLAIFGDTASVESALAQIKQEAEGADTCDNSKTDRPYMVHEKG